MKETHRSLPLVLTGWLLTLTMVIGPMLVPMTAKAQQQIRETARPEGSEDTPDQVPDIEQEGINREGDNFKSPKAAERYARRQEALKQKIAGKKSGKVVQVAKGLFSELELEKTDKIFVVLVEYGTKAPTTAGVSGTPGPLHNAIPEPNRAADNNTIWQADYNRAHYEDMYFNKMAEYYRTQSSGRYTVDGAVTEWVKVPFNGPRYGNNGMGDAGAWTLIADAINIWTQDQLASGKTIQEVTDHLKTFDTWDRYDYDGDGNFNEPDGYIDHFQIVHSGNGEETGGGQLGADAIWSHRWQAWYNRGGVDGPSYNKDGGVEFGGGWGANPTGSATGSANASVSSANPTTAATVTYAYPVNHTGIWVGDYTIQPENGGLGVFAHEFGHDLGLPDHYDTAGGDNATGFWTIMSSGSYLGDGTADIGARPGDFGAWDKLQLGWLNFSTATAGVESDHKLGPAETNTKKSQAVVVSLPPEKNDLFLLDPTATKYGTNFWWGGKDNNLDTNLTRTVTVPTSPTPVYLAMRMKYAIESNWDYAYVSVSTNGGTTWTNLAGQYQTGATTFAALTTAANPNGQNLGNGITGTSIANATFAPSGWRNARFDVTPYAGQTVLLRIRYKTDAFTVLNGVYVDEIKLGSFEDGTENGNNGWTLNGFKASNGVEASNAAHYYIAEYRQYRTYDEGLKTGPYFFGDLLKPNWVDHFPYQDGMLITYWDTDQANNNTSTHFGEGLALPIDAHPDPLLRRGLPMGGTAWNFAPAGSRYQSYDSTFGLEDTDPLTYRFRGSLPGAIIDPNCATPGATTTTCQFVVNYPSLPANPLFNDLNPYWSKDKPDASVIVPRTGTTIRVVNASAQGTLMQVHVGIAQ